MPPPLLTSEALCRYYHRGPQTIKAVDQVSLSVHEGDFTVIVGSSGSGKSTLLNLLAGLDTPSSGTIDFKGARLSQLSRKGLASYRAHNVGMVFQAFNLLQHRTALENVELALYFNDTDPTRRRPQAQALLEQLGLSDRMTHRPSDLSGGEQQRIAIARALVKKPDILFADEPTGNLDRGNSAQIVELFAQLNREGLTIVMVTHNHELAAQHAKRIIRMDYGRIVDDSSAEREGRP